MHTRAHMTRPQHARTQSQCVWRTEEENMRKRADMFKTYRLVNLFLILCITGVLVMRAPSMGFDCNVFLSFNFYLIRKRQAGSSTATDITQLYQLKNSHV